MKYVYVLTSSENDLYYEQFYISVVSLRLHNPAACIVALIDSKTKDRLGIKRSGYEKEVSETITITAPEAMSQREVSRWIKTSMKKYVAGDFLYIDCDTVIAGSLDYDFPPEVKVGAIPDTHVPLLNHHLTPHFEEEDRKLEFTSSFELGTRYNGGVIFCRDTPEGDVFFSKWHALWLLSNKKGNHHDMPALNQANLELGGIIKEIGGEWNCQITHNGLPYLHEAKIIHYYATSFETVVCPYLPASKTVLASVKETGNVSLEIMEMLKKPKAAFERDSRIVAGEAELDVLNSKLFSLLLRIRKKNRGLFKSFNSFVTRFVTRFTGK